MRASRLPQIHNLSIGELSKRAGVSIDAVRYYENVKLLRVPARTMQGRRIYADSDVRVLIFVRRARELGFTIDQIRVFLRLGAPDNARCHELRKLASRHLDSIRAKITELTNAECLLVQAIAQCSRDATSTCPIPNCLIDGSKENAS
jgi:MerR family mercuric resistance operon transcriptional regulator